MLALLRPVDLAHRVVRSQDKYDNACDVASLAVELHENDEGGRLGKIRVVATHLRELFRAGILELDMGLFQTEREFAGDTYAVINPIGAAHQIIANTQQARDELNG